MLVSACFAFSICGDHDERRLSDEGAPMIVSQSFETTAVLICLIAGMLLSSS